eukprot:8478981-Pyramimonas_sp.AAC.1
MTGAREASGHDPWTIEDMRDACDIHARSVLLGLAGRRNWWLNGGRMDRGTRQERGLVTIALPRGGGTCEKITQRKLARLASVGPAMGSNETGGTGSG